MTNPLQEQIARLREDRDCWGYDPFTTKAMNLIDDLESLLKESEKRLDEEIIINQKGADREERLIDKVSRLEGKIQIAKSVLEMAENALIFMADFEPDNPEEDCCDPVVEPAVEEIKKALATLNGE